MLIFDDTPIDVAARGAAFGGFVGAGQTCIAGSRLLIQRTIYDDVVAELSKVAATIRIGDPGGTDHPTRPGHLQACPGHGSSATSTARCATGARLAAGGHAAEVPGLPGGFFIEPTVLADVTNDMRVAREEIFGPVVVAIPFEDEAQAVALANDSDFGLGLVDLDARRGAGAPRRGPAGDRHGVGQRPPPARPVVAVGRRPRERRRHGRAAGSRSTTSRTSAR